MQDAAAGRDEAAPAQGDRADRRRRGLLALMLLGAGLLVWSVIATAWLCDDALITFRTVENFVEGHGLRWNLDERVQTFTHPLWLFLVATARTLGSDYYYGILVLSMLLSLAGAAVLGLGAGRRWGTAALVFAVLASSRAFVDFSTSGLETPLTTLLLALLAAAWLRIEHPVRRLWACGLLSGLLLTNRLDLLWAVLPVLLSAAQELNLRRSIGILSLCMVPLLLWLLFATFYYGTPLPSTAYSKALATGLTRAELVVQGFRYTAHLMMTDPTTGLVVIAALPLALLRWSRGARALLIGAVLQAGYVIAVGGDFMAGRFFLPSFVLAMAGAVHTLQQWPPRPTAAALAVVIAAPFLTGLPPWASGTAIREQPTPDALLWGIGDERSFYWQYYGLWAPSLAPPQPGQYSEQLRRVGFQGRFVGLRNIAGVHGFLAGDLVHVVDRYLCDPLLVRLPAMDTESWRIGHFARRFPEGLLESIAHDDNRIRHPGLRAYYGAIREVTRGPLFSGHRLSTMVDMWLGRFDEGLGQYLAKDYWQPPVVSLEAAELDRSVAPGQQWFAMDAVVVLEGGVEVRFDGPQKVRALEIVVDGGDNYSIVIQDDSGKPWRYSFNSAALAFTGMAPVTIDLPDGVRTFDRLRITATPGTDHVAALGALRILR